MYAYVCTYIRTFMLTLPHTQTHTNTQARRAAFEAEQGRDEQLLVSDRLIRQRHRMCSLTIEGVLCCSKPERDEQLLVSVLRRHRMCSLP